MPENRLYNDLAWLWPLVSKPEDYANEAAYWRTAIRKHLGEGRHDILELGVGGGNNLSHLTSDFQATAIDLSPGMLEHSKKLNPTVEHLVGDMRTVRLDRTFDAVLIHDAINYMLTEDDIRAVLATASVHLRSGGLLVMAPDYVKETFKDGTLHHNVNSDSETTLTFVEYDYDPDPEDTTYKAVLLFLIRRGGNLQVEEDHHTAGLFADSRWVELIEEAGFLPERFEYPVHGDARSAWLYLGIKK
jgi:hypothetical protein